MRYYRLEITRPDGSYPPDANGDPIHPFDTLQTPGRGLHIEFDALITGLDTANGGTMLTIYGLPITMLTQAVQLVGCNVRLDAGFQTGLPLADPTQAKTIIRGQVLNAFANWLGTHQTLNLVINPTPFIMDDGTLFSVQMDGVEGEKMSDVLLRCLGKAYRERYDIEVGISDWLILPEPWISAYPGIDELATAARSLSKGIIQDKRYLGVQISVQNYKVVAFDGLAAPVNPTVEIQPRELLGQPTWIAYNAVSFKCPLRGDLHVGDYVKLPKDIISGNAAILSVNSADTWAVGRTGINEVNFSGEFLIISVRQVGQFLNPDGNNAWVTIYEAVSKGTEGLNG